ncbi:MAG: hypothetical protein AB1716_01585 [Planctomycetota bacterium]
MAESPATIQTDAPAMSYSLVNDATDPAYEPPQAAAELLSDRTATGQARRAVETSLGVQLASFTLAMRRKLNEDAEEAQELGEDLPSSVAVQACEAIGQRVAAHILSAAQISWGVFLESGGGISLVFQSFATDRRLSCRFGRDSASYMAVTVDEDMNTETRLRSTSEADAPKELADWLISRG